MKCYQAPVAEMLCLVAEDVLTASVFTAGGTGKLDDLNKVGFGDFQF